METGPLAGWLWNALTGWPSSRRPGPSGDGFSIRPPRDRGGSVQDSVCLVAFFRADQVAAGADADVRRARVLTAPEPRGSPTAAPCSNTAPRSRPVRPAPMSTT